MRGLRRAAYVALAAAYLQVVWGAIVRISGSGMGCGDDWPVCNGQWLPRIVSRELAIEMSHRFGALLVTAAIAVLLWLAWRRRAEPGVGGAGGVLRPSVAAAALVVITALFGAATVRLGLSPLIVVAHLVLAMALLGVLAVAVVRAGGFGAESAPAPTTKALRGTYAAAVLAFLTVLLGGLTANLPGAALACRGFPACTEAMASGGGLHVHLTHRVLALLLLLHLIGLAIAFARRAEPPHLRRLAWTALGVAVAQIAVAAVLVTLPPSPHSRSAHQALGTLLWTLLVAMAAVASLVRRYPALADTAAHDALRARRSSPSAGTMAPSDAAPAETPTTSRSDDASPSSGEPPATNGEPAPRAHTVAVWVARGAS